MPFSINTPNFWNLTLDNFINKSERVPDRWGRYSHAVPPGENETVIDPNTVARPGHDYHGGSVLIPSPEPSQGLTPEYYNRMMNLIEDEAQSNIVPYNSKDIKGQNVDPDIMDAVMNWLRSGGARRF